MSSVKTNAEGYYEALKSYHVWNREHSGWQWFIEQIFVKNLLLVGTPREYADINKERKKYILTNCSEFSEGEKNPTENSGM